MKIPSLPDSNKRYGKFAASQLKLRSKLWPEIDETLLWLRKKKTGFITIPRTLPIIQSIMDDMANGMPVSSTYFDLWCRSFDECFVTLSKPNEIAFSAGFTGQRGPRTWAARMRSLSEMGFIKLASGASGPISYALILNPHLVIKKIRDAGVPGIREDKYNALIARALEIGADDFGDVATAAIEIQQVNEFDELLKKTT